MDNTSTLLYITSMVALEDRAASMVRDIDPTNALLFARVRSRKFEVIVHTGEQLVQHHPVALNTMQFGRSNNFEHFCIIPGDDYVVIVIQNPNEAN